jgi:3-hydroxybutyryl-CoA dehydrogenase
MIQQIGVIGAGQMGSGIAHVCALAGLDVTLLDIEQTVLDKAVESISSNLDRQVARGRISETEVSAAIERITATTDYAAFGSSDAVVEAATENEDIKRQIFKTLVPHLHDQALIASNTSSISITRLAATTDRPERFIGLHFMNPVPVMKLVEIIVASPPTSPHSNPSMTWPAGFVKPSLSQKISRPLSLTAFYCR